VVVSCCDLSNAGSRGATLTFGGDSDDIHSDVHTEIQYAALQSINNYLML